jgi:hypothetical protein
MHVLRSIKSKSLLRWLAIVENVNNIEVFRAYESTGLPVDPDRGGAMPGLGIPAIGPVISSDGGLRLLRAAAETESAVVWLILKPITCYIQSAHGEEQSKPWSRAGQRQPRLEIDPSRYRDPLLPLNAYSASGDDTPFQAGAQEIHIRRNCLKSVAAFLVVMLSVKASVFQWLDTEASPPKLRPSHLATRAPLEVETANVFTVIYRRVVLE